MSNEKELIGEELFIEELGEVRGGLTLAPGRLTTLARGLGEEGTSVRVPPGKSIWIVGTPPPRITTMMLGEEGTTSSPPVPLSNDE